MFNKHHSSIIYVLLGITAGNGFAAFILIPWINAINTGTASTLQLWASVGVMVVLLILVLIAIFNIKRIIHWLVGE